MLNTKIRNFTDSTPIDFKTIENLKQLISPDELLNTATLHLQSGLETKTLEEIQMELEQIPLEFLNDKNNIKQNLHKGFIRLGKLFNNFPKEIATWLYKVVIEFLFFQNVKVKTIPLSRITLFVSPIIQHIYTFLERPNCDFLLLYKEHKKTCLQNKENPAITKKIKNRKIRRLAAATVKKYIRLFVIDLLIAFNQSGFNLEKVTNFSYTKSKKDYRTNFVIYLKDIE